MTFNLCLKLLLNFIFLYFSRRVQIFFFEKGPHLWRLIFESGQMNDFLIEIGVYLFETFPEKDVLALNNVMEFQSLLRRDTFYSLHVHFTVHTFLMESHY